MPSDGLPCRKSASELPLIASLTKTIIQIWFEKCLDSARRCGMEKLSLAENRSHSRGQEDHDCESS